MSSEAKRRANRANARLSSGPRTSEGKRSASKNARQHGLNVAVLNDPDLAEEVEIMARRFAGDRASETLLAYARRVAEPQVDLQRIRLYRHRRMLEVLNRTPRGGRNPCDVDGYPVGLSEIGVYQHMLKRMRGALKNWRTEIRARNAKPEPPPETPLEEARIIVARMLTETEAKAAGNAPATAAPVPIPAPSPALVPEPRLRRRPERFGAVGRPPPGAR